MNRHERKQASIRAIARERARHEQMRKDWHEAQNALSKMAWLRFKILERLLSEEPVNELLMKRIIEYVESAGEKKYLLEVDSLGRLMAPLLVETQAQLYHVEER